MMQRFMFSFLLAMSAATAASDAAVEQLRATLAKTDSIGGDFVQTVKSEEGETLQRSEGKIIVQRPLRMRWESTEPYHYLLVTDGETLWRYDADLEQLNVEPFSVDLARAPAMILTTSTEELASHFDVSRESAGGGEIYTLTPRGEAAFERLRLHFRQDRLTALDLEDSLGQITHVELRDPVFNRHYDSDTFVFSQDEHSGCCDEEPAE